MKKALIFIVIIAVGIFVWKLMRSTFFKQSLPGQAVEAVGNYIPSEISRKDAMQRNIEDSVQKETKQLQKSLDEVK